MDPSIPGSQNVSINRPLKLWRQQFVQCHTNLVWHQSSARYDDIYDVATSHSHQPARCYQWFHAGGSLKHRTLWEEHQTQHAVCVYTHFGTTLMQAVPVNHSAPPIFSSLSIHRSRIIVKHGTMHVGAVHYNTHKVDCKIVPLTGLALDVETALVWRVLYMYRCLTLWGIGGWIKWYCVWIAPWFHVILMEYSWSTPMGQQLKPVIEKIICHSMER